MVNTYSTYDAKAKFSEIIRRVREGETVVVSYRGDPVAEIKPVASLQSPQEKRNAELERRGALIFSREQKREFKPAGRRPGALKRFLEERHH